jgi:hypothetical protein
MSDSDEGEYVCEQSMDDELDCIFEIHNDLKTRFPYFFSDIDNFTKFILHYLPNESIDQRDLNLFEDYYNKELTVTFNCLNKTYCIDNKSWLEYCYLYNN